MPQAVDPKSLVDPELHPALEIVLQLFPPVAGPLGEEAVAGLRTAMFPSPFLPSPPVSERQIPGPTGAPDVTVFVINSDPAQRRPAILHMHGGGYIAGEAKNSVANLQTLAEALDCVVVTVDYRLAPEAPFPASLEDNYAALKWLHANAAALGVDPARIALQGESAGGGHAAMLAFAARDRGEVPVCFALLNYPMLDDRTGSSRPTADHVGTFLWRPALNVLGWRSLLGQEPGGDSAPKGAVPARETDLAGLPPTCIAVGGLDLFVDEDIDFARRLIGAGVPTELIVAPGAFHAFDMLAPLAGVSRRYRLAMVNAMARALGRPELAEAPAPPPFPAPMEAEAG